MPFDFNRDCRSRELGWDACRLLRSLEQPDGERAVRGWRNFVDPNAVVVVSEETRLRPRVCLVRQQGADLILLRGCYRRDTGQDIFLSYNDETARGSFYFNALAVRAANSILDELWLEPSVLQQNIWIVGHSYGGMIAQALWAAINNRYRDNNKIMRVVTFGSPRCSFPPDGGAVGQAFIHARWFNDQDPVRHLIPHSDEAPAMHGAVTRAQSDRYNRWAHTSTGLCLRDSGVVELRADTPEIRPIASVNLLSWATGVFDVTQRDHSLVTYETRLMLAQTAPQPVTITPANRPMPADVQVVPPAQNAPAVQAAIRDAVELQVATRAATPNRPRIPLFRARKVNGNWTVVWNNNPVAICNPKRHARSVASRGNQLLRRLEDGDIDGLSVAMQAVENMANS